MTFAITLPIHRPNNFYNALDSFFDDVWAAPKRKKVEPISAIYNVTEVKNGYDISIAAPGRKKEDFKINVEDDILEVSYETPKESETSLILSSFNKTWRLPENADVEGIVGKYEQGILTLNVPVPDIARVSREIVIE
jgi:HSP20 family protein|tara:strand:- start:1135 stop:1545 length:411 start_codon:yes stop_codon:yes gene_type:complete